jgi:phosphomannomutase
MELFGTAGVRGDVTDRVTPELAVRVGRAAGDEAAAAGAVAPTFVVGRDGRTSGPGLAAAVEAGLESAGAEVVRLGVLPTPALAFASRGRRGVMLTASHNPPTDNGLKLFVDGVEYDRERERAVERRVDAGVAPVEWDRWGASREESPLSTYRDATVEYARGHGAALDGLRVVVDCGNGVGSLATPAVLDRLGATVVALNANVDGHFPGRESKPTAESLGDLSRLLAADEASLGFAHDGDADRVVVVDGDGELVHEDTVLAVLAAHYVASSDAADPVVVTTPNASGRVDERVAAGGGRVERVRLGALHEGVAAAREAGGDVVFAAEPWKHVHPAFGGWIDGVATAAVLSRLVAAATPADGDAGDGLAALRAPVTERPYRKADVACPDDAKAAAMERVETRLPEAFPGATATVERGVRLAFPDASWVLVRPSGTEPYLRVYAESDDVDALLSTAIEVCEAAVADARGA